MKRLIPYPNIDEIEIELDLMNELKKQYFTEKGRILAYQKANRMYGINATMVDKLVEDKLIIFHYKEDENKEIYAEIIEEMKQINGKYIIKYPIEDKKIYPEDYRDCWVSNEGEIYFCGEYQHINTSYEILKRILKVKDVYNSESELEDKGWFRISSGSIMINRHNDNNFHFTQKQIDKLFEIIQIIPIKFLGDKYTQNNYSELLKRAEEYQLL